MQSDLNRFARGAVLAIGAVASSACSEPEKSSSELQALEQAHSVRIALQDISGADWLDARFDWDHPSLPRSFNDNPPCVYVPGTGERGGAFFHYPADEKHYWRLCSEREKGLMHVGNGRSSIPYRSQLPPLVEELKEILSTEQLTSFLEAFNYLNAAFDRDIPIAVFNESCIIHELVHLDEHGGEFAAYTRQFNYLMQSGVLSSMPERSELFRFIIALNSPRAAGEAIAELCGGNHEDPVFARWVPGGTALQSERELVASYTSMIQELPEWPWKTQVTDAYANLVAYLSADPEYMKEFSNGVENYYRERFRERFQDSEGLTDNQLRVLEFGNYKAVGFMGMTAQHGDIQPVPLEIDKEQSMHFKRAMDDYAKTRMKGCRERFGIAEK